MLTVEQIEVIRRAYYCEHKSVRAIARELGHGRRVIREAISGTSPTPRQYKLREAKPRPVIGPVAPIIDGWLEQDRAAPRKQRHTAKRVYDRLVQEHGFKGSERQVREYVRAWKRAHEGEVAFIPLAYSPGVEAQCDWGEALVRVGGVEQTAQLFCMRLAYSLKPFVCAFPTARQECFLAGHLAAFEAFGGVPHLISYDNLTTAVLRVLSGRARVEQDSFIAFRGHYLFESHYCLPGIKGAHEKPFVESLVGYSRLDGHLPISGARCVLLGRAQRAASPKMCLRGRAHGRRSSQVHRGTVAGGTNAAVALAASSVSLLSDCGSASHEDGIGHVRA